MGESGGKEEGTIRVGEVEDRKEEGEAVRKKKKKKKVKVKREEEEEEQADYYYYYYHYYYYCEVVHLGASHQIHRRGLCMYCIIYCMVIRSFLSSITQS